MSINKITYIISDIDKAITFEWIVNELNDRKFKLSFILINSKKSYLKEYLLQNNIPVFDISCIKNFNIPYAILKCTWLLRIIKPDVVHTHLFKANIIGLVSAKILRVKKCIYTRHHSDFHHVYHPKAIKYDKFVNFLSTEIIAISEIVKNILVNEEHVNKNKIHLINHGFDLENFESYSIKSRENLIKKYNPEGLSPTIGVISRFTHLKGIQFIIPAFKSFLHDYPNSLLLLFNATGEYEDTLNSLLSQLPKKNYKVVKFEHDITTLYHIFDLFIHVPINATVEAFGQTYVEALAAGIPSIFTLSGIANEFIKDRENAIIVPYQNSEAIYHALIELINNVELRNRIITNGKRDVQKLFQLSEMIYKLEELYSR
jgi:glycosyltransferase involved in cell wall biosynthesis